AAWCARARATRAATAAPTLAVAKAQWCPACLRPRRRVRDVRLTHIGHPREGATAKPARAIDRTRHARAGPDPNMPRHPPPRDSRLPEAGSWDCIEYVC